MAKYRQIHTSFWEDGFVLDLTPEEKYFYLYLMTNPKTSQCGIYELPRRIIEIQTGYNVDTVQKLLQRFTDYARINYFDGTKEVMLVNWIKYNPPTNLNAIKCIVDELKEVKYEDFKNLYISMADEYSEYDTEGLIRGLVGANKGLPSNKIINNKQEVISNKEEIKSKKQKKDTPVKIKYAEFVSMTEEEFNKLITSYGELKAKRMVEVLDNYKGSTNKKYASDYRAILSWVVDRVNKEGFQNKPQTKNTQPQGSKREYGKGELEKIVFGN